PATGLPFSSTRPTTLCTFEEFASHGWTTIPVCTAMRARPAAAARTARGFVFATGAVDATTAGAAAAWRVRKLGSAGGVDCFDEPPSANTWSSLAVPPPDEVGVPPEVIARYSLPSTE